MTKVKLLEQEVSQLSTEKLEEFRTWFTEFEWRAWDHQIAQDAVDGKLDDLARKALEDHEAGRTKSL